MSMICFGIGIASLNARWYERLVRWQNELRGTETKITNTTILMGKVTGLLLFALGILMLILFFSSFGS